MLSDILNGKELQKEDIPITYGLLKEVEKYLISRNLSLSKHVESLLTGLNKSITFPSQYKNFARKVEKELSKGAHEQDVIEFLQPSPENQHPGKYCELYHITTHQLDSDGGLFTAQASASPKVGLIAELEQYRRQKGYGSRQVCGWVKSIFLKDIHSTDALLLSWKNLFDRVQKAKHSKIYDKFAEELWDFPKQRPSPKEVLQEKLLNPPDLTNVQNPLLTLAQHAGTAFATYSSKMERKVERKEKKIKILQTSLSDIEGTAKSTQQKLDDSLEEHRKMEDNLSLLQEENETTKEQLEITERKYRPKNVDRRIDTKVRKIASLENTIKHKDKEFAQLKEENNTLHTTNQRIESDLQVAVKAKKNAQKLASKWRQKSKGAGENENDKMKQLNNEIKNLENENELLKERVNDLMQEDEVVTFHGGRYNDTVRQVCHILLSEGVSMSKAGKVIRTVLSKLGHIECGRLPGKSTLSNMAAECDIISKIHVGQLILDEAHTTLHLDGTRKKFREYSTFQVSTTEGSKSLGFKEMVAGATSDYMEATKDLFQEISVYLSNVNDAESQEVTEARLLRNIMNTQTDRHVVNKSYREQLKEYKSLKLPLIIQEFSSLSAKEVSDAVRINGLMCGMHAVHGVGKVTKDALKDFENIACPEQDFRGFQKSDSRAYSLLWEISKAFTQAHDYQKAGVAHYYEAHLTSVEQKKNHLISLRGERINAVFVMGAASFFHKQHILEFIAAHNTEKNKSKLLTSIQDLDLPVIQVEMRSLGIMGKLLTGPLIRLIEAPQQHILHMNDTWLHVISKLEEFAVNSSPLLEGMEFVPGSPVTKDEVYHRLFDPQPPEIEDLTGDCLRLICCNAAILLKRQLQDQLPGGIFYQPSEELLRQTATAPAHNIVSERDFAQLDRQIREKPSISTVSMSGLVTYSNNRTPDYLDELSEEERHNIITKAIKQARINRQLNHQRKKEIKVKRIEEMQRKKEKREADAKIKEARKIEATNDLMNYGGLWCESIDDKLGSLKEKDKKKAVLAQLKYRRLVLNPSINRSLFHVSSQGKAKGLDELIRNLKEVVSLSGAECSSQADKTPKSISAVERKDKIDEAVKRKHTENHSDDDSDDESDDDPDKPTKQKLPDLVGKSIMHRWEENGEEKWVYGKVRRAKGNISDIHCEFVVEYNDGLFDVPLYEDFNSGDLTIVWYMYTKPN